MKKFFPVFFALVFLLVSFASAGAAYEIMISVNNGTSAGRTVVIANSGDRLDINSGDISVTLSVLEKQDGALNFLLEPELEHKDEKYGTSELGYFLQPQGEPISFTNPGKESPVLTVLWKELALEPFYEALINKAAAVLGQSEEYSEEYSDEFSVMFRMAAFGGETENFGYYVMDLDNDGTAELLFGENYPDSDKTVLYDLYAVTKDGPVHVFDGWDRSRYYLTDNGYIAYEGSSSAFQSVSGYYIYKDGELNLVESIIYDSNADPAHPLHLSLTSLSEFSDTDRVLDDAEAAKIRAQFPQRKLELEPFIK